MQSGTVQQTGAPLEVYGQPANRFVAGFIGSPAMNFIEAKVVPEDGAWFIATEGFRVRVPETFRSRLEPHVGRQVIFGVRPEDLSVRNPAAGDREGNTLTARADVVETLGSEVFVYLTCGDQNIVARMEVPEHALTVGQTVEMDLKMSKTHIFDKETSLTIV